MRFRVAIALPIIAVGAALAVNGPARASSGAPKAGGIRHTPLGVPWAPGERAKLLAGPHRNNIHSCAGPGAPCNSLDFVPKSGKVRSAGPGIVQTVPGPCLGGSPGHRTGLVVIKHTTGGKPNGWWTGYYHLRNIQVTAPHKVDEGTYLGDIGQTLPCKGSPGPEPHVHFFVKYAPPGQAIGDPFQNTGPDVNLNDVEIGGWTVTKTGSAQGCMTYLRERRCSPNGLVMNYGGKHSCEPTSAVRSIDASGVDCDTARRVVDKWSNTPGCGPDGHHCRVLGFDCVTPKRGGYEDLECTDGDRLIAAKLRPF